MFRRTAECIFNIIDRIALKLQRHRFSLMTKSVEWIFVMWRGRKHKVITISSAKYHFLHVHLNSSVERYCSSLLYYYYTICRHVRTRNPQKVDIWAGILVCRCTILFWRLSTRINYPCCSSTSKWTYIFYFKINGKWVNGLEINFKLRWWNPYIFTTQMHSFHHMVT